MFLKVVYQSILICAILLVHTCLQSQIILPIAGNGTAGFSGDDRLATQAELNHPRGIALGDKFFDIRYIADQANNRISQVEGIITTVAGTGTAGFNGDNIRATDAELNHPRGIALGDRFFYIADQLNNRIRQVDLRTGIITTVAGTGTAGFNGDNIRATDAELNSPAGVAVSGNLLYIADQLNNRIRRVNLITGIIETVAGTGTAGFNGDNIRATDAELNSPADVAVTSFGIRFDVFYIADQLNNRIRRVDLKTGIITTVAGTGTAGFSGDGGPATQAELNEPQSVDVFASFNIREDRGSLFIADTNNQRIRRVELGNNLVAGIITTVAGNGTAGFNGDLIVPTSAELNFPSGVLARSLGGVYIADQLNNRIRLVLIFPSVTSLSPNTGHVSGGTIVNIAGSGFLEVSQVLFGETPAAAFTVNSDTSITAISPPGVGIVSVRVVTSSGTSPDTPGSQFFYTLIPVPTISSISPNSGPTSGGTAVTITGNEFINIVQVLFGETPALSFTVNSKNSITAISPPGTGTVDIRVVSNAEISPVTPADQFTYHVPAPSPPANLRGRQVRNRFATQTDLVNIITWRAPSSGETPVAYKIYRDATLTELIKTVRADGRHKFKFKDHNRRKHKSYTYFIVSVDAAGNQSVAASVTVEG
jgi:hypothetical protein